MKGQRVILHSAGGLSVNVENSRLAFATDAGTNVCEYGRETGHGRAVEKRGCVARLYTAVQGTSNGNESASFGGIETKVTSALDDCEGMQVETVAGKTVGTVFIPMDGESGE